MTIFFFLFSISLFPFLPFLPFYPLTPFLQPISPTQNNKKKGKIQTLKKGGIAEKFEAMQSLLSCTSSDGDHKNGHDLLQSSEAVECLKEMIIYKEGEGEGAEVKNEGELAFVVVYNKKAYEFTLKRNATVQDLKSELRSRTHIEEKRQLLVGGEVMVDEEALLWDYGVREGARLTLVGMAEKELREKWGKEGEGEEELYKKYGSCSSFRSMALLVLYQVAKEKDNCGDVLKMFGIEMFFDVLNQVFFLLFCLLFFVFCFLFYFFHFIFKVFPKLNHLSPPPLPSLLLNQRPSMEPSNPLVNPPGYLFLVVNAVLLTKWPV